MNSSLEALIRTLPDEFHQEVEDFVRFLLERRVKKPRTKPKFNWAGALKDLKEQYTSVQLQHQISGWRTGNETAD
jgi:hypothetical protein